MLHYSHLLGTVTNRVARVFSSSKSQCPVLSAKTLNMLFHSIQSLHVLFPSYSKFILCNEIFIAYISHVVYESPFAAVGWRGIFPQFSYMNLQ